MKQFSLLYLFIFLLCQTNAQTKKEVVTPSSTEVVSPIRKASFNNNNDCPERRQGGNPRWVSGYQVFNGSMDGNRQVDPQIAVGGGFVMEGSNSGLIIYNKQGTFLQGVSQKCFNLLH